MSVSGRALCLASVLLASAGALAAQAHIDGALSIDELTNGATEIVVASYVAGDLLRDPPGTPLQFKVRRVLKSSRPLPGVVTLPSLTGKMVWEAFKTASAGPIKKSPTLRGYKPSMAVGEIEKRDVILFLRRLPDGELDLAFPRSWDGTEVEAGVKAALKAGKRP